MTSSPKHILVLSSWFPTEQSPYLGNFVVRQIELLAKKYKVSVITLHSSTTISKTETTIQDSGNIKWVRTLFPKKKTLIQRKLKQKRAFEESLERLDKIDLIIGHVLLPNGWQFILAKRKFNCPLFYVEHGSYFHPGIYNWRRIDQILKKKVGDAADEIIAVSQFLKNDLEPHFPGKAIKVISNHIDRALFPYEEKQVNTTHEFLHISTLDERVKNPLGILKAASVLSDKNLDFHLTIISDEDYSKWRKIADELKLGSKVDFIGPLNWEELAPYYHRADAFVLFSSYESFSIVIAEAWSTGTPVISTPVGIAADMREELGIQIHEGDIHKLAGAMERIISGKTFDGKKISDYSVKYSSDRVLDSWTKLIESYG